jgi:hypothetical protein
MAIIERTHGAAPDIRDEGMSRAGKERCEAVPSMIEPDKR